MNKRIILVFLVLIVIILTLQACGRKNSIPPTVEITEIGATFVKFKVHGEYADQIHECRIDGGKWETFQDLELCVIDDLEPNKDYTLYARIKATSDYSESSSVTKTFKTIKEEYSTPPQTITYTQYEKFVEITETDPLLEFSFDKGMTYTDQKTKTYDETGLYEIWARYKDTQTHNVGTVIIKEPITISTFAYGHGTQESPYVIKTKSQFLSHRGDNRILGNGSFSTLEADLDFEQEKFENYLVYNAAGTFDGNGHTLSNIDIEVTNGDGGGIFSNYHFDCYIKNLNVVNVNIKVNIQDDDFYCSIGIISNEADEIVNCNVTGRIDVLENKTMYHRYIGGICGFSRDKIVKCSANVAITFKGEYDNIEYNKQEVYVGGLACNGSIYKSYAKGSITISNALTVFAGGLTGVGEYIVDSCSAMRVEVSDTSQAAHVGGIAGQCRVAIENCYAVEKVYVSGVSTCYMGGLVGKASSELNKDVDVKLKDSFIIFSPELDGFSYSTNDAFLGTIIGLTEDGVEESNCYYVSELSEASKAVINL
ncbi:MAG: hypothetical protein LBE09_04365, partial [Christensenellaceae bacterium]|nr:hypothetical protein [Christensenellaceae bacterium]